MVQIDFNAEALLAQRTGDNPWEAKKETPVRLNIGGVELLGWHDWDRGKRFPDPGVLGQGKTVSVIHFARWGLAAILRAEQEGKSGYWLGEFGEHGDVLFRKSGEDILVYSIPYDRVASISFDKLLAAWRGFSTKVRAFLLSEYPNLEQPPWDDHNRWERHGWKEWLRDGEVHVSLNIGHWSKYYDKFDERFEYIDAIEP